MRLIDADRLIADLKMYGFKGNALAAAEFVANADTVQEAVIPVRCCECESYESGICHTGKIGVRRRPYDYCSKGVKKRGKDN